MKWILSLTVMLFSTLAYSQENSFDFDVGWQGRGSDNKITEVSIIFKNISKKQEKIKSAIININGQDKKSKITVVSENIDASNKDKKFTFIAVIEPNYHIKVNAELPTEDGFTYEEVLKNWTNITVKLETTRKYEINLKDKAIKSINEIIKFNRGQ